MINNKQIWALLFFSVFITESQARDQFASVLEEMTERGQLPEERAEYFAEQLQWLYEHPVNINQPAHLRSLTDLYLLDMREYRSIVNHRDHYGDFVAVNELIAVKGITKSTIRRIAPFIIAEPPPERAWKDFAEEVAKGEWEVMARYSGTVEDRAGHQEGGAYIGPPGNEYFRINRRHGTDLSMGITASRQSGEPYSTDLYSPAFNFYSGHFYMTGLNIPNTIAVGDYQLQFGQGLLLWTGFGYGVSGNMAGMAKAGQGIRPYRSRGRANFFRGIATEFRAGNWHVTPFFSRKKLNATIHEEPDKHFTNIDQAGYTRTSAEMARNNSLTETMGGWNIKYEGNRYSIGTTFKSLNFDTPFSGSDNPRDHFQPEGDQFHYLSLDYDWNYKDIYVFGEVANQFEGGWAILQGVTLNLHETLDAGLILRNYTPGYHPFYSNAFRQGSLPQNEQGLFWMLSWHPATDWEVTGYADHHRSTWLTFSQSRPAPAREYRVETSYRPGSSDFWSFRYSYSEGMQDESGTLRTHGYEQHRMNTRFRKSITSSLSTGIGVYTAFRKDDKKYLEPGQAIYKEFMYRPEGNWDVTFRYTLFRANDFENRIYLYEHSVLYDFSFPFFMDEGHRGNIVVKRSLGRNWNCWFKVGRSVFYNTQTVSSGPREISVPRETDFTFQVRWNM